MTTFPPYAQLRGLPPAVIHGALATVTPVWEASHEHEWQREVAAWEGITKALSDVVSGDAPAPDTPAAPRWVGTLVRRRVRHLRDNWTQHADFVDVRTLERLGVVVLEPDDDYVLAMVSGLGDRWGDRSRAELLREDPELVGRALWRLFEVEGGGQVSLANVDKFSPSLWRDTFLELVSDGTLDRGRVLDSCLRTLGSDFSAYRVAWFAGLYRALRPTAAEQAERQAALLDLLRSPIGATVSLAARSLAAVEKAGQLDERRFLNRCDPGLDASAKTTVAGLLRILEKIAARAPGLAADVAARANVGMRHPDPDVQRKALRLLQSLGAAETARSAFEYLDLSVRHEAAAWLGGEVVAEPLDPTGEPAAPNPASALRPMAGDLVDRVTALLEQPDDAIELELALAGLAELDDPGSTLTPLLPRAAQIVRKNDDHDTSLRRHLAGVLVALAGRDAPAPPAPPRRFRHLAGRLREVTARNGPLLATPTDGCGWLDPDVLVARAAGGAPARRDGIAALLRLAPDGRGEALGRARDIAGKFGEALRYALGGRPGPVRDPALWVAAGSTCPWWGRHRGSRGPCKHVLAARLEDRRDHGSD